MKDGKPAEYKMRVPGKAMPEREELGDNNPAQWEAGPSGEPKDPWQNTRFLLFARPGNGRGVHILDEQLGRTQCRYRSRRSNWAAFATRAPASFRLSSCKPRTDRRPNSGRKSKPFFKVVDWRGGRSDRRNTQANRASHAPVEAEDERSNPLVAAPSGRPVHTGRPSFI